MQDDALGLALFGEPGTDEYGAVVGAQLRRSAVAFDQPGQHLHDPGGEQGEINFDAQELSVVIVEHVEDAKPAAGGEHVAGKVERPTPIDGFGYHQRLLDAGGQPLF